MPTISKASAASAVKEKAPPDSGSAEALLALAVGVAVALALAIAEALAVGLEVDVTLQFVGCGSSLRTSSNGSAHATGAAYSWLRNKYVPLTMRLTAQRKRSNF